MVMYTIEFEVNHAYEFVVATVPPLLVRLSPQGPRTTYSFTELPTRSTNKFTENHYSIGNIQKLSKFYK